MQQTTAAALMSGPHGRVPRVFPASRWRLALWVALALGAGFGSALWLDQLRYERFSGYLQARVTTVVAGRDARIARLLVEPGTIVAPGRPLVALDDPTLEQRIGDARLAVETQEIELARTEAALEVELDLQRRDILDRIFEARWRSAQLLRQQELLPREALLSRLFQEPAPQPPGVLQASERSELLFAKGRIVQTALGLAIDGSSESPPSILTPEMELCAAHIAELERIGRELPDKISRSMGVPLVQSRLAHARTTLAAVEGERQKLTLVAQTHGLVGVFHRQAGDRVTAHEPIVQLLDEEQPYLLLQVPTPRVADFAPGTVVELRFPGGAKGKGRVEEIPPQTSALPDQSAPAQETMITAHVDPVGSLWPELPFGSVVEVRRRR